MMVQALSFLLEMLAGFLTVLLLLRFFMQLFRVSFSGQLGGFVVQLTNWLVKPLRKIIPGVFGLDLASLLPAYLCQALFLTLIIVLRSGGDLSVAGSLAGLIAWQAVLATLRTGIYLLIAALFLQAILSWVNPYAPLGHSVAQLTRPFLEPLRRVIPAIAGVDLSPFVAIVIAQLVLIFLR